MNTDALNMTDHPNTTDPTACPTSDALSEYYEATREGAPDGGLPDVHRHVRNCPQCQAVMRFYKSIDGLVGKAAAPDDAFVDRILRECHRAADNDKLLSPVIAPQQPVADNTSVAAAAPAHPAFMRVYAPRIAMAAGLLLLGGSIALHYLFTKNLSDENQFLAQQQAELLQNTTIAQRRLPLAPSADGPQMAAITPGDLHHSAAPDTQPVPSNNILAVSFQNDQPTPAQPTEATRHIDKVVRHTWLVRDLKDASQFLNAFNGQHGITVQTSQHTPGRLIVSLRGIRDTTLQKLVDVLEQRHWALVSPMFPQPRQASRIDFTNRPVTYTVRLVESNRPDFRRLQ